MSRSMKMFEARCAIEDVLFGYAEAIDCGHLERLEDLLGDCELALRDGTTLHGAAIAERYRNMIIFYDEQENEVAYSAGRSTPRTRHVTTNVRYEFDSAVTEVTVRSYFSAYQTLGGVAWRMAGGRYEDRFRLLDGNWRMVRRIIHVDDPADLSRHIKPIA
jgi:3-phenylpropionate/cinnamic acid dioxygenase small subunit